MIYIDCIIIPHNVALMSGNVFLKVKKTKWNLRWQMMVNSGKNISFQVYSYLRFSVYQ